jgi:predicted regulator of Ras-like GTPase activity (Roadblock/LC7/MglB family)
MFTERLQQVAENIDGFMALAMVAADGIPVESIKQTEEVDFEILAAELMAQVRAISQNHQELAVGTVKHFAVTTDRMSLMVSALSKGYYLLLVQRAGSNIGKARFELRRAILLFEKDLM